MFYYQNSVCCIWYLGVCSTVVVSDRFVCLRLNWPAEAECWFQFCVVLVFKVAVVRCSPSVVLLPASNEATKKC